MQHGRRRKRAATMTFPTRRHERTVETTLLTISNLSLTMNICAVISNLVTLSDGEEGGIHNFRFSLPPLVADIPPIAQEEALQLAAQFLGAVGLREPHLTLELHAHFVAVFRFCATQVNNLSSASGWVVGGSMPHLELNDQEIQTPIEALAIYALYERTWLNAKGMPAPDGSVPIYRVPPDWAPLTFTPGFEDWRMGARVSFIAWNIVRKNPEFLLHADIRAACCKRGWIAA